MKTLKELNFTENQSQWCLNQVPNFQGIVKNENEARILSAKIAEELGHTDYIVKVSAVWNGLHGNENYTGYTVGFGPRAKPLYKNGVAPIVVDTENEGFKSFK